MARLLRIAFSLILIAGLLWWVGVQQLLDVLSRVELRYIALLFLLAFALIWVSCVKWRLFLRASGNDASLWVLFRLYVIGYFFNLFLPSFIGGDIARSYQLGQELGKQRDAFVSTFMERFTGLLAMAALGTIFVCIGTQATAGLELAVSFIGFVALVLALVCFSERIGKVALRLATYLVQRIFPSKLGFKTIALMEKCDRAFAFCRSKPALMVNSLLLSFVFHVLTVLNTEVAALAIGWHSVPFSGLFIVTPLVLLVSMVPLTPNGLGLQEGAFLFLLGRIGASQGEGLAVGLLLRVKVIIIGLIGGLFLLTQRKKSQTPGDLQA